MAEYRLTQKAEADLLHIALYDLEQFGLAQAQQYYDGMTQHFAELAAAPYLYQAVDHIRAGMRRSVYGSHAIYYRIDPTEIVIVRILGQQDTAREL